MIIIKGVAATAAIQGIAAVPTSGLPYLEIGKLILQAIVAIGTLWHLKKQSKKDI
jgi:hypothetical protein